jgi:hypothetical protein
MFNCYGYGIRGNEQLTQDDINCKGKFADKLGNFVSVAETLFPSYGHTRKHLSDVRLPVE